MSSLTPSSRGHLPESKRTNCWYGASCHREYCIFVHPTNPDGSPIPRPFRDDRKANKFDIAETYHPDRALKAINKNINHFSKSKITNSIPAESPITEEPSSHRMENQKDQRSGWASGSIPSRDPRRRASINQNNAVVPAIRSKPEEMSQTTAKADKMDIDQPVSEPQKDQTRQIPKSQTNHSTSKSADTAFDSKHTDDVGKQTKASGQDDLIKPQQTDPSLPKHTNSEMALKLDSSTIESTLNQEVETNKLPSYKAISELITLRFKVSEADKNKRQCQSNLERYKASISKAQSEEEKSMFEERYDCEKNNLQRAESDFARHNSRARTYLIEFANWIAPIPQHTAIIASYGKAIETLEGRNKMLEMLITRHDETIQDLRAQIPGHLSSKDTFITKDEHIEAEEKLIDRLVKLENITNTIESLKPKNQHVHNEAPIDKLEMRLQDLETKLQKKDTESSREPYDMLKNDISDLFTELGALKIQQTESAALIRDNAKNLNALDNRVTKETDHLLKTSRAIESRHADIIQNSAEFAKQLTNRTNGLLQTYKDSMDHMQLQINGLAKGCGDGRNISGSNESLHTSLQVVEASLHKLFVAGEATDKAIREMASDILRLKHGSGNDVNGQLHQTQLREALQSQMQDHIENMRRGFHKFAIDINAKLDSFRYLDQRNGSKKITEIMTPAIIDLETATTSSSRSGTGSHTSSTNSVHIPETVLDNPLDRRLGVLEMQLLSLRQRFDGFTMDQHIKSIVDVLRQLWPHNDIIMRRIGMIEQQSQAFGQTVRDVTDQMGRLSTSKVGVDDLEQLRTSLDTAVVSITENKQLLDELSKTSVAGQKKIDHEEFGTQCLAFLRGSTDFSGLVEHLIELQYQSVRKVLADSREEYNMLRNDLYDVEQRLTQQEFDFDGSKLSFEKFKHDFNEAIGEQIQMEKARSEKIKKSFKDLNLKIENSKRLEQNSNLQSLNNELLAADNNARSSSSPSAMAAPNRSGSSRKPKQLEEGNDLRSSENRQPIETISIRSSSSPGLGECVLRTRKKRKFILEDSGDD